LSLDIDFPQSSVESIRHIDLKELQELVEANAKESQTSPDDTVQKENNETESNETEVESTPQKIESEPSAPSFEENESLPSAPDVKTEEARTDVQSIHSKAFLYEKSLYPDLNEVVQAPSSQITEKILSPVAIKPFTPMQIEQLYSNKEIQLVEMFEGEFVAKELKDTSIQDHPLYTLLKKYGKSRAKFLINSRSIAHLSKKLDENYNKIWRIEKRTVSGHGFCECGKSVRGCHDFYHAVFDEDVNSEMNRNLKELMNMSCFNHTKFSQDYELHRRQIEQMIGELMNDKAFSHVHKSSPVVLNDEIVYPDMKSRINDLRLYISILFKFLRDAVHDKFLITCVQDWIKKLVGLQLRVATWQDHVFLIFHILRCPVGVGNWAANLIQVPFTQQSMDENPFSCPEFQHCVALLSALLLPVKDRGTFLEGITKDLVPSSENVGEDIWILVDSDGEEGSSASGECIGLKENDLVAIYDQIPFEMLFQSMTLIEKNDDSYELDVMRISGRHIICSIAFSSKFIAILKRGLTTYETERYKQFAKRLGRLMKHTLFYVSDLIQLYRSRDGYKDQEESLRIQVEFDELITRSTQFIYASQKLSLFQYLADFPYHLVSTKSLWKLFYYLHVGEFRAIDEGNNFKFLIDKLIFKSTFFQMCRA
jgi:ectopic P granules protein 5